MFAHLTPDMTGEVLAWLAVAFAAGFGTAWRYATRRARK